MAEDREPPALFDDDADTQETERDEAADSNPFTIGETTEITLDGGETKPSEKSEGDDKGATDPGEEKTDLPTSGAAASVDVTNLSKPSEDESELPPKEKPEVGFLFSVLFLVCFRLPIRVLLTSVWALVNVANFYKF